MKHDKYYYKGLPRINGFRWVGYDEGFHMFTKAVPVGLYTQWKTCFLTEEDVNDIGQLTFMLEGDYTRKQ